MCATSSLLTQNLLDLSSMAQFVRSVKMIVYQDDKHVSVAGNKLTFVICLGTYKAGLMARYTLRTVAVVDIEHLTRSDLDRDIT